jgi:hypothetical protein
MRISNYALAVLVLPLGLMAAARSAQQDFRWSGRMESGQRLEIKGVHGAIRAQPATGDEALVTAVIRQGRRGRVQDVRVERVTHAGGVTLCAIYPSRRGRANRCTAGDEWNTNVQDNDVEVAFTVHVPRGVHFLGATVNGAVDAQNMPANADVSSVNGEVRVSAAGVVEASTVNGAIHARTGRANPGRDLDFTSVNGNIFLTVPAAFGADVHAELLNGRIESDFPLQITRGRYVGQTAEGRIGRGGNDLHVETVNGNIEIRRGG